MSKYYNVRTMPVEMPRTYLGNTDTEVSKLAIGTLKWNTRSHIHDAVFLMRHAFQSGVNFIDTSDNYGLAEEIIGIAFAAGVLPRDGVVIATKVGMPTTRQEHDQFVREGIHQDTSSARIRQRIDVSLQRLGVEAVDLYQVHAFDPRVNPLEIVEVMNELIRAGKIKHWGVSNYHSAEQVNEIVEASKREGFVGPVSLQNSFSIVDRRQGAAIQAAHGLELSVLARSPLQGGMLTERLFTSLQERRRIVEELSKRSNPTEEELVLIQDLPIREKLAELQELALDHGANFQQFAIAWLMHQTGVIPILGAYKREHFDDLVQAVGLNLDDEVVTLIDEVVTSAYSER